MPVCRLTQRFSQVGKARSFRQGFRLGLVFRLSRRHRQFSCLLAYCFEGQKAGLPADVYVPYTAMSTATIFFVMALPMLLYVKERSKPKNISFEKTFKRIRQESVDSFKLLKRYPEFLKFCVCGLFYQAGIAVVITLSAVYAQLVMKFTTAQTITLILVVNITAAIGAFVFGYVQDRLGHKKTLALTILLWIIMGVMARSPHGPVSFGSLPILPASRWDRANQRAGQLLPFCSGRRTCPVLLCLERRRLGCQCFGPDHIRNSHLADVRRSKNRNPRDDTFLCYRTFNPSSCAFAV